MRYSLSLLAGSAVLTFSLFAASAYAGDCNKTVMGGGCSGQAEAGVSPHMQSQNPLNAVTKAKAKESAAAPAAKVAAPAKPLKVSNAPGQKPQI
jgi:hypothetical protein